MAFISVQHGHGIKAKDYEVQPIRTGGERSLSYRMGAEFAQTASETGKVIELTSEHVAVEYKSGIQKYQIGEVYLDSEGTTYNNNIVTTAKKVGDVFKEGDVITFNDGFFQLNPLEPRKIDYMSGCLATIALREALYTLEDSCSLSEQLAGRLETSNTKKQYIRLDYNQSIGDLVKLGDTVDLNTILCTIEDSVSTDAKLFDEATRESLKYLSAVTPKASVPGVVSNIEIVYKGDVMFMSESLSKITKSVERKKRDLAKKLDIDYVTNEITGNQRIGGHSLSNEQAVLVIYINRDIPMGIGDL